MRPSGTPAARPKVVTLGGGRYLVEHGTEGARRRDVVYVTGSPGSRWVFWNGRVYNEQVKATHNSSRAASGLAAHSLTAPMPATVLKVNVKAGDAVKKGDVVVLLEAMKMEMPVRAETNGLVVAVHCRDGELVAADSPLVELQ